MRGKFIDLQRAQFGRWIVTHRAPNAKNGAARWHCVCSCGRGGVVSSQALIRGDSRSCGCLQREVAREVAKNLPRTIVSHIRRRDITFKGETRSLTEWSAVTGIGKATISNRLRRGWSVEQALTIPAEGHHKKVATKSCPW